jgi:hypothetical protein
MRTTGGRRHGRGALGWGTTDATCRWAHRSRACPHGNPVQAQHAPGDADLRFARAERLERFTLAKRSLQRELDAHPPTGTRLDPREAHALARTQLNLPGAEDVEPSFEVTCAAWSPEEPTAAVKTRARAAADPGAGPAWSGRMVKARATWAFSERSSGRARARCEGNKEPKQARGRALQLAKGICLVSVMLFFLRELYLRFAR